MKVGVLLKIGNCVYLSVNNPNYVGLVTENSTYDYIYDEANIKEDLAKIASYALGDQTGYYISEERLRKSKIVYSPFDNVHLFIVEITEDEDHVVNNIAEIMYSDYVTMPTVSPLITLEKILITDLKKHLKKNLSIIGKMSLKVRDASTLLLALTS